MQIRCGTFNLYQFSKPPMAWYKPGSVYSSEAWESKKKWIKDQLLNMNCDVIGFQEVFSVDALRELIKEAGFTYFSTVEMPTTDPANNTVYTSPVVAIGSKYPITSVDPVIVPPFTRDDLPITHDFKFSRTPIKAKINIQDIGDIIFYVAHLKSKRPVIKTPDSIPNEAWDKIVLDTLRSRSQGHIASLLQRGLETTILYHDVTNVLQTHNRIPIVILGDLNDDEHSIPLEALTNRERVYEINGIPYNKLTLQAKQSIYSYTIYDAFDMAPNPSGQKRIPTHYYNKLGNVLDYILVSNAFNERNPYKVGRITNYKVLDDHLKADGIKDDKQSDHAQVVITIETI
ncbi:MULTISPECIES: endonuclease/exonuclease/phosphatase family protein [Bacillus cereus group]|uniref:endonuclease/exonuclease/phosphatase family protein n=1 Tax=Bacillus cereus group TaxID=86661 RepID=UPI000BF3E372|nr:MULTISPECIES: endonuclease/exonuclease/phosphatase family protein [Bacillus cereus group]PFK85225.1 endonuclease [Bacillus thuringiensis]WJX08255.1 endonuclease/exonuclease/phosphatase family protein [Bacillus cereus]